MRLINKKIHYKSGFSLLELLLAVTVVFGLMTAVTIVINDSFDQSIDRKVAREMRLLQSASEDFVRLNLDNIITNDIPTINSFTELDINDLIASGFLPAGYGAMNSYRQPLRVILRNIAQNTLNGDVVEVITFSDGPPIENSRLFNAARNGQKGLGVISDLDISAACCNGNIQSLSGEWSVTLTDLDESVRPTAPNLTGGYMAAYGLVSVGEQTSERYLFRDRVDGQPQRNRMQTNLNMRENDIVNAGIIVADDMEIQGNLTIDGTSSPYVLAVRNGYETNNLSINFGTEESKGNLIINGDDTPSADLTVTGNLTNSAGSSVSTSVPEITVSGGINVGGVGRFGTLDMFGSNLAVPNAVIEFMTFDNGVTVIENLQASNVGNVNDLNANAAISTNLIMVPGGAMSVASDLEVTSNVLIRDNATINDVRGRGGPVNIQNLDRSACGATCP